MTKLSSNERNQLDDSEFGIPEKRMYPLNDKSRVESAVKLFGHADPKDKRELAKRILAKAKEFDMDTTGWKQILGLAQEQSLHPTTESDELLERINGVSPSHKDKVDILTRAKDIAERIHARYEADQKLPTGNQNCQLCTWCAEANFRGMNVLPRPIYSPRDPALEIKGENIVLHPDKRQFKNFEEMNRWFMKYPNARFYVHVKWNNGVGGHEFLLLTTNVPHVMDAQQGIVSAITDIKTFKDYFTDINFDDSYICRLDDHTFNDKLFNEMNDPSKIIEWDDDIDIPYMKNHGMIQEQKNDEGEEVPEVCDVCGSKIGIYLKGEPVYCCSNKKCGKYFGTVPCNINEASFLMDPDLYYKSEDVAQEEFVQEAKMTLKPVDSFDYEYVYVGIESEDQLDRDRHVIKRNGTKRLFISPIKAIASVFGVSRHKIHTTKFFYDNLEYIKAHFKNCEVPDIWWKEAFQTIVFSINERRKFEDIRDTDVPMMMCRVKMTDNLRSMVYHQSPMFKYVFVMQGLDLNEIPYESIENYAANVIIRPYNRNNLTKRQRMFEETQGFLYEDKVNTVQEGALQDIKNGVNPYSDKLVFHITDKSHFDGQIFKPRVPEYLDPYDPNDNFFEDNTTPRISFSSSIEGCLNGIMCNMERDTPERFDKMYVYIPEKPLKEYRNKTNKQLVDDKDVWDANVTREIWITEPVRMKLYGTIQVDQIKKVIRKQTVRNSKNEKHDRPYFTFKWHWVVPPKVLNKATKFDYSVDKVTQYLSNDIKRFKYGLIRDGKLQTGNVSDVDYDKYWVFHSGEEVDKAGGGNCYDFVEYEAGYLEAYGISYKKYFLSFTTKQNKPLNTHTICVVPYEGKFIYIEGAFKRITDEWGYIRRRTFDTLNEIFDYVAECSADYLGQNINFGVWDYTSEKFDQGTKIKDFVNWIFKHCKMVYDGEASKPSNVIKEGYRMPFSRFFQENEEMLSNSESITVSDLNLNTDDINIDDDDDDLNKTEEDPKSDNTPEKSEDQEEDETPADGMDQTSVSDDDQGPGELPEYLKDRMSSDDLGQYENDDETAMNVNDVNLGSFGSDTSDVHNDYDQKDVDTLMKLMASETQAMSEYLDATKETNVDVLRRLYADIANEERFHLEQLLFAKSELTGEKYEPRDPDVKSEYEELLAMGMDEETAMQTAVDKCHIRGSIQFDNDDEQLEEIQDATETLEYMMLQFNMNFDHIMEMVSSDQFTMDQLDSAVSMFTEACITTEAVYQGQGDQGGFKQKGNPIKILRNALGFLLGVAAKLLKKFGELLRWTSHRSKEIQRFIKQYGVQGFFKDTVNLYFYDMKNPKSVNTSIYHFQTLVWDVFVLAGRQIGIQVPTPPAQLPRAPMLNTGGDIDKGISMLNGVDLVKTKMVLPEDRGMQDEILGYVMGYTQQKTSDGKSLNLINALEGYSESWSKLMERIKSLADSMENMPNDVNSPYHRNRARYEKASQALTICVKACKAFINALSHDINVLSKLNADMLKAMKDADHADAQQNMQQQ